MNILGISCYYHDAAACLVKDGILVAAAQEERFSRKKNDSAFPINAINYCVQAAEISFAEIDYVAFYEKPYLKFSRVIFDHLRSFPFSYKNFLQTIPYWLQDRLILPINLQKEWGFEKETVFIKHHLSHASAAFLVSPFQEAAILVADGVGEYATTSFGYGKDNMVEIHKEIHYPDSLGMLYAAVTSYLGLKANSGEGTTMALASYGKPVYLDAFYKMADVKEDGSFTMNGKYFGFIKGSRMYSSRFKALLGPARKSGEAYTERHKDIAASLQKFVEETLIKMANHVHRQTKSKNLCLAGGVFLNCVANQKICDNTPFENVFIQPASGDAGGALGAAMNLYNCILDNPRHFAMAHAYWGPAFTDEEIKRMIAARGLSFEEYGQQELVEKVAGLICDNKTVGWFQGRMEFGPRALGNRSILANACNPQMPDMINKKIKNREWFRPFAPIVTEENAQTCFEMTSPSPFMLLAPKVKQDVQKALPAITHVDGTARVQTVSKTHNPLLHGLLCEIEKICGFQVAINTSFNLQGEPIVCTPDEALNDYLKSDMDCLVLGNIILKKV